MRLLRIAVNEEDVRLRLRLVNIQQRLRAMHLAMGIFHASSLLPHILTENLVSDRSSSDEEYEDDDEYLPPPDSAELRPSPPPMVNHPAGFPLTLPDQSLLQINNYQNFEVNIHHSQAEKSITVEILSHPPTIEALRNSLDNAPSPAREISAIQGINLDDQYLVSQINEWKPETWTVLLPAPPPLVPDNYAAFGYTIPSTKMTSQLTSSTEQLSYIWVPSYGTGTRTATVRKDIPILSKAERDRRGLAPPSSEPTQHHPNADTSGHSSSADDSHPRPSPVITPTQE